MVSGEWRVGYLTSHFFLPPPLPDRSHDRIAAAAQGTESTRLPNLSGWQFERREPAVAPTRGVDALDAAQIEDFAVG